MGLMGLMGFVGGAGFPGFMGLLGLLGLLGFQGCRFSRFYGFYGFSRIFGNRGHLEAVGAPVLIVICPKRARSSANICYRGAIPRPLLYRHPYAVYSRLYRSSTLIAFNV